MTDSPKKRNAAPPDHTPITRLGEVDAAGYDLAARDPVVWYRTPIVPVSLCTGIDTTIPRGESQ